ncbi:MAG: hypothetical protein K6C94_09930 [Candidatus Gastranaerophilales bacterium]|nr:hypothetical protein [Candidatus Gastranaerophilales bacterium]
MTEDEFAKHIKPKHTLSTLNKTLCRLLMAIIVIMTISYYITTLMQESLTKLSGETMKLNNENIELQNKLDNLMSYHNVEELVGRSGKLNPARHVIDINADKPVNTKKNVKKYNPNYYRWSLGF